MPRMPSEKMRMPISASSRNAPDCRCRGLTMVRLGVIALIGSSSFSPRRSRGRRAMAGIGGGDTGVGVAKLGADPGGVGIRRGDHDAKQARTRDVRISDVDLLDRRRAVGYRPAVRNDASEAVEGHLGRAVG